MPDSRPIFSTDGATLESRNVALPTLLQINQAAAGYVATPELAQAVDAALLTGLPLLLTGEPGCGKTQLAYAMAYQLGVPLLRFDTKSSSSAKDLLYRFDIVGRFYDAENRKQGVSSEDRDPGKPGEYVMLGPLGAAILLSKADRAAWLQRYPHALNDVNVVPEKLTRCVVLIDEVDKAPRDFPNDLLNELENFGFRISETGESLEAERSERPFVVLTSNAERDLPEPFLRRCAYFHLETPDMRKIVEQRLGAQTELTKNALEHFQWLRKQTGLERKPSVAELLVWLRLLEQRGITMADFGTGGVTRAVTDTYLVLFKTKDDLRKAQSLALRKG
jgi:MoxR-like ATPase